MNTRSNRTLSRETARPARRGTRAFTLIELLVVIAIIGLMAKVALPALKGMNKSNSMITAQRQLLDDLAFARRSAIANRTDVYMVFIPPWIGYDNTFSDSGITDSRILSIYTNVYRGQLNAYAILALRSVGDQPGQATPRYLTDWRYLPQGVFIPPVKFTNTIPYTSEYDRTFATDYNGNGNVNNNTPSSPVFPFPTVWTNSQGVVTVNHLPYIGFDYLGRLKSQMNEAIPLVRGSAFYTPSSDGTYAVDFIQQPTTTTTNDATNVVHIDWLTGRARFEQTQIQ